MLSGKCVAATPAGNVTMSVAEQKTMMAIWCMSEEPSHASCRGAHKHSSATQLLYPVLPLLPIVRQLLSRAIV